MEATLYTLLYEAMQDESTKLQKSHEQYKDLAGQWVLLTTVASRIVIIFCSAHSVLYFPWKI